MNRKKINSVTITLYILFLIGALLFGYLEHLWLTFKCWIVVIVCLSAMFIVGIVRAALLKADNKKVIEANAVRVVKVNPTKVEGNNVSNKSITDELPLVHVDSVDPKKVIIKVYKNKVLLSDSIGTVISE